MSRSLNVEVSIMRLSCSAKTKTATRLGLQCQTQLRSYPLTLIPNPCSLSPNRVPYKKFRWGLLWLSLWLFLSLFLLLLSKVKVKSTPSLRPKTWSLTINSFKKYSQKKILVKKFLVKKILVWQIFVKETNLSVKNLFWPKHIFQV